MAISNEHSINFNKIKEWTDMNLQLIYLQMLIDRSPENVSYILDMAMIYHYMGALDLAIMKYLTAIDKLKKQKDNFKLGNPLAYLGVARLENKQFFTAIYDFERYLSNFSNDSFITFLLGTSYAYVGDVFNSIKNYEISIILNSCLYKAHMNFGQNYEKMNRKIPALQQYKIANDISPNGKLKEKIDILTGEINSNKTSLITF